MSPSPKRPIRAQTFGGAILTLIVAAFLWWNQRNNPSPSGTPSQTPSIQSTPRSSPSPAPQSNPKSTPPPSSEKNSGGDTSKARPGPTGAAHKPSEGEQAVLDAFKAGRSDFWATVEGKVFKILPDDRDGDQHQKFLMRLPSGHSLLIAHNIDIAPRVPCKEGDTVTLRGEYEWKDQGGVMHWTHRDPSGRKPGGWIELNGKKYE